MTNVKNLEILLEEDKLSEAARALIQFAGDRKIFLFNGEMGAGKTTFIKALCKELGVDENMSSPTYSIVNEYINSSGNKVFHFDLYRLKNIEECFDIGMEEYLDSGDYCFIEWPEIAQPIYPLDVVNVTISVEDGCRKLRTVVN
jgi:tRNA threonylcarbamoyladenosine biosynthesis protein TsaE